MTQRVFYFLFLIIASLRISATPALNESGKEISLSGVWKFRMDPLDQGVTENWFSQPFNETIVLPASMTERGLGDPVTLKTNWTASLYDSSWYFNPRLAKFRQPGNLKFPFFLTPVKQYVGAAWYQKEISVPASWTDKRIVIFLERAHWETMIWIDGKQAGMQNSLSVPHQYAINEGLAPGKHLLTIRIDNRIKAINPGKDSHSISDQTQGNWNGIVGKMKLISTPKTWIEDIQIYPNLALKSVKVKLTIKNAEGKTRSGILKLSTKLLSDKTYKTAGELSVLFSFSNPDTLIEVSYPMGDQFKTWDEFHPECYQLDAKLITGKNETDARSTLFGMREFKTNGTRFEMNGKVTFLRGTVENCDFPLTGYPPEDEASWARVFKICRNYGLNHMRFHSYCPPEAAFIAADKAGIYLQIEGPSWCNHGTSLGNGKPIDKYLLEETDRILKEYGNHPSFCMMAYGNEPSGNYVKYLNDWVTRYKELDSRHLYTGASTGGSWKIIPNSEFMVRAKPRGLPWSRQPQTMFDFGDKLEDLKVPYLSHEVGQYCVFPDFSEIKKYTGPLKALNFELFEEDLKDQGMGDQGHDFMMASGKLQALCYKAEIEAALRTPGFAGFQLLSLNDYSGQGTALVGMLNVFWEEKGYLTAPEFKHFCDKVVPLARIPKFVYTNHEEFKASFEVANFSGEDLTRIRPSWKIMNSKGRLVSKGEFPVSTIPQGNCIALGSISQSLTDIGQAEKLTIEVTVGSYFNNWNIWVYPSKLKIPETGIYSTNELDSVAVSTLKKGGKVFLNVAGKVENGKDVIQYFTPVFWNTSWFKMKPPHTTGFLCNSAHPAFADFPTEYHSNLQWWEIVQNAQVMQLDNFPEHFKPILQPIDTWFLNRKLAMIFEAKIGPGKLLVCSTDLQSNPEQRPAARQLLYSLKKYMASEAFQPTQTILIENIRSLFENKSAKSFDAHTSDSPDELKKTLK
jgi:hypothetical protein